MTAELLTKAEARTALGELRRRAARAGDPLRIALVPTMGALHQGHLSLVALAGEHAEVVVVSVFVNPLQFGPGEDFDRYPRTYDDDLVQLRAAGADYVFAPAVDDMYPDGPDITRVVGGPAAATLEGEHRPGHFDGMLTVVHKLLSIVEPDVAVFGEKDAQQLFLIRAMVRDLDLPVEIVGAPIVREPDGLARSSRNRYLRGEERQAALALSRGLAAAAEAGPAGREAALAAARAELDAVGAEVDYVALVDPATFLAVDDDFAGEALALVAARIGATRLIDNRRLRLGS